MNRTGLLITAGALLALTTGAGAFAQSADPSDGAKPAPMYGSVPNPGAPSMPAQTALNQAPPAMVDPNPPGSHPTDVTPYTAPPAQVGALAAGDNRLTTNGPVLDTPANRARYRPLSHAGRVSPPKSN